MPNLPVYYAVEDGKFHIPIKVRGKTVVAVGITPQDAAANISEAKERALTHGASNSANVNYSKHANNQAQAAATAAAAQARAYAEGQGKLVNLEQKLQQTCGWTPMLMGSYLKVGSRTPNIEQSKTFGPTCTKAAEEYAPFTKNKRVGPKLVKVTAAQGGRTRRNRGNRRGTRRN